VVATFRAVGAPKRLTTIVEGESLFNDGTAIVVFHIMLAWVIEGTLSPIDGVIDFVVVSLGGILVGVLLGYAIARIIANIVDYLIEITLTTVLAFGSYLLAEQLHVSGVLAVVAAGLFSGEVGSKGMSFTTRTVLTNFWEYIAFLANSFVFILIGLNVQLDELTRFLQPALIAVAAVLVARAVTVYLLGTIVRYFKPDLPNTYLHIMVWGGLRGAVSLALVLSLPLGLADRRQLLAMTFAVVLFTLLAQATTIPALLGRLGFSRKSTTIAQYERLQGELLAARAASRHLDRLLYEGGLIPPVHEIVKAELDVHEQELITAVNQLLIEQPTLKARMVSLTRREVLRAERAALETLVRDELLDESTLNELQKMLDEQIEAMENEDVDEPVVETTDTLQSAST
jgi:CPA1 family monovalent cation:H+ antiporter